MLGRVAGGVFGRVAGGGVLADAEEFGTGVAAGAGGDAGATGAGAGADCGTGAEGTGAAAGSLITGAGPAAGGSSAAAVGTCDCTAAQPPAARQHSAIAQRNACTRPIIELPATASDSISDAAKDNVLR